MANASGAFISSRLGAFTESQMKARGASSLSAGYSIWVQTAAWGAVAWRVGIKADAGGPNVSPSTLIYPGTLSSVAIPDSGVPVPDIYYDSVEWDQTCWRRVRVDVVSTPDPNTGTGTSEDHYEYTHPRSGAYQNVTSLNADQEYNTSGLGSFSSSGSGQHWASHSGYLDGTGIDNPAENSTESGTNIYGETVEKECVSSGSSLYVEWTITTASGVTVYRITWDTPLTWDDFLAEAVTMYETITPTGGTSSSTSPDRSFPIIVTSTGVYEESSVLSAFNPTIEAYANETDIPGGGLDTGSVGRSSAGVKFGTNGISIVISGVRYRVAGEQMAKYVRTCGVDGARDTAQSIKLEYSTDEEITLEPDADMLESLTEFYIATQKQLGQQSDYTSPTPDFPAPS